MDRILNIASSPNHNHSEETNSNDGEEHEMSRSMKGMMEKYQLENNELRDHIAYLENLLQKEKFKTKTLLPQYRETVEKLKRSAYGMKERLQESQNLRKEEKNKLNSEVNYHLLLILKSPFSFTNPKKSIKNFMRKSRA